MRLVALIIVAVGLMGCRPESVPATDPAVFIHVEESASAPRVQRSPQTIEVWVKSGTAPRGVRTQGRR